MMDDERLHMFDYETVILGNQSKPQAANQDIDTAMREFSLFLLLIIV